MDSQQWILRRYSCRCHKRGSFGEPWETFGRNELEKLGKIIDEFDSQLEKWKECHIEEEDEIFEQFYDDEYCGLGQWCWDRSFDSGHLVGGPIIGCFRCEEKIKILWESTFELENGNSIWTAPKGSFEISYNEFVSAVTEFLDLFLEAMNKQVENAVMKEWGNISLDKDRLVKENEERKKGIFTA